MATLQKIQTEDPTLNRIQDALAKVLNPISVNPQANPSKVKSVKLLKSATVSAPNIVNHGLPQAIQGWSITEQDGPAMVWRVPNPQANPAAKQFALLTSADVTVDLSVH
jgi:hypothetical protein